jgi:hypothetical protein
MPSTANAAAASGGTSWARDGDTTSRTDADAPRELLDREEPIGTQVAEAHLRGDHDQLRDPLERQRAARTGEPAPERNLLAGADPAGLVLGEHLEDEADELPDGIARLLGGRDAERDLLGRRSAAHNLEIASRHGSTPAR